MRVDLNDLDGDDVASAFDSKTFDEVVQILVDENITSASISPCGRDVVLASQSGLHIVDLDKPRYPPRHISHLQRDVPADVQWSPFAARPTWIVSTSNQKALVFNVAMATRTSPIEFTLHAHTRAITDINFSAHHPDILATCSVDSYVYGWDLRKPERPVMAFADFTAAADQVKWNRQDSHIIASSHDRYLKIWDDRKGAHPLRIIKAHTTKIYGIDWSRTRSNAVLTCSLDQTMKFWDINSEQDVPQQAISTTYQVWRARHTPFGHGVLAMPQRVDHDVHLYDRRAKRPRGVVATPDHSFSGHEGQVKEFLWRIRGGINDGVDQRDFQLVTWGMDRILRLHPVSAEHLRLVGHQKGQSVRQNMNFTRHGAPYKTFRPEPHNSLATPSIPSDLRLLHLRGLGALVSATGMSRLPASIGRDGSFSEYTTRAVGMRNRVKARKAVDPVKWIEGVAIGKRDDISSSIGSKDALLQSEEFSRSDTAKVLNDEILQVKRFSKVQFEELDIDRRKVTVTMEGPWGSTGNKVFVRLRLDFPEGYPYARSPEFVLEKTTSTVAGAIAERLKSEIKTIMEDHLSERLGCLEAVVLYLLGDRRLDELRINRGAINPPYESSSDEEEPLDHNEVMGQSGVAAIGSGFAAPVPRTCGAVWSVDGRLVVFRKQKTEAPPLFSLSALKGERGMQSRRIFESVARYHGSPGPIGRRLSEEDEGSESDDEFATSSSSSSGSSREIRRRFQGRFTPPAAWRGAILRQKQYSQQSSADPDTKSAPPKPKSLIAIEDLQDMLPAKFEHGERYSIFGDPAHVCASNAATAEGMGDIDLASIWNLIGAILHNDVPLEILPQSYRSEPILALAKRAAVRIKKKDSGIDLQLDEPESVTHPKLKGRVKWGNHPFAGKWMIPRLFEYFESLADVQMLAMMACVFAEPAATDAVSRALQGVQLPSMKCPAFSLDYFASSAMAWSLFQRQTVMTPAQERSSSEGSRNFSKQWDTRSTRLGTYGSAGSSNGPWSGHASDPITPLSMGNTPPAFSRASTFHGSAVASYSSSPDLQSIIRKSQTNLTATFAALKPALTNLTSSSPPARLRRFEDADLSTSAPTGGQVTWGNNTVIEPRTVLGRNTASPKSKPRARTKSGSIGQFDGRGELPGKEETERGSDTETDIALYLLTGRSAPGKPSRQTVKLNLSNQHLFDQHAHASVPLLENNHTSLYAAYRAQYADVLHIWNLDIQAAEVLKYNGLPDYWQTTSATTSSMLPALERHSSSEPNTPLNRTPDADLGDPVISPRKKRSETQTSSQIQKHRAEVHSCCICWQPVERLTFACLNEGMVAHTECAEGFSLLDDTPGILYDIFR